MEDFVDEIYEAALVPERWVTVLDRLAGLADAEGSLLFAAATGEPRWLSSEQIKSRVEAWLGSAYFPDNPRAQRLVPRKEPRFLTDLDAFTAEEIEKEPYYTSFLRSHGLGWCVGTSIQAPSGDTLVFSIERAHAKGPVSRETAEKLDPFRPHLARAALVSARLGWERCRASVDALNMAGLPAAVLGQGGKVLAANTLLSGFSPEIRIGPADRLELSSETKVANLLAHLQQRERTGRRALQGASIPMPSSRTHPPFVAHLFPIRGAGRDVFTGAELLLYLTPVIQQRGPPTEILQALFDLTPAEARVAGAIAQGRTVNDIAGALSVQPNTVRVQLKSIFAKTGVSRQAELASLLRFHPRGSSD